MTDTFSYLLFPKLFCPKKLSLVTKTLTGPFFMCGIEAFCLFLRTNCIKGFLMFRLHQDILHSILIFQKKWSHVISRDVLESFHVYQISIRFHPLCQSHSKETIFIWKNPVKRQKKNYNSIKTAQQKGLLTSRLSCQGRKRSVMHSFGLQLQPWQLYIMISTIMFFSKLTKPEVQNSCQKYYKGVVGQRRGNNRLQNSPYFYVSTR